MSFRKNVVTKKLVRYLNNLLRPIRLSKLKDNAWANNPPILVNSFPKSGTHLLHQIVSGIPNTIDYGNFIASTPSLTFSEVSSKKINSRISGILPGEIVASHIHYSELYNKELERRNIFKLFIYRDLRDVTISEAHYLSKMNKWHKLSPEFSKLESMEDRIMLSLNGLPSDHPIYYPNVAERFRKYKGWLTSEKVLALRFEDVVSSDNEQFLSKIAEYYLKHRDDEMMSGADLVNLFQDAIDPKKSHTFRSGKKEQWKDIYTNEMLELYYKYIERAFYTEEIESFKLK